MPPIARVVVPGYPHHITEKGSGVAPSRGALLEGADLVERGDARAGAGGLDAVGGGGVAEGGCVTLEDKPDGTIWRRS